MRAPFAAAALLFCLADALVAQIPEQYGIARTMLREAPHVRVVPGYTLVRGKSDERTLTARVHWVSSDTAPRLSVSLLGDVVSAARDLYSRSGIEAGISVDAPLLRLTGTGNLAIGAGSGPSQILSVAVSAGVPAVDVVFRTTWLRADTASSAPFVGPQSAAQIQHGYTDGELHGRISAGPVRLLLATGMRFGGLRGGPRQWLWGEAAHPISDLFSVVASGGTRPQLQDLAQHGGPFAQIGIRFETGGADSPPPMAPPPDATAGMHVRALSRNRYALQLRLAGAQRVELVGDVTDWTPVTMRTVPGLRNAWELVLEAVPGVYAINIRTDGSDWMVPPGLIAVPDGFGGSAGMLILPEIEEDNNEGR